MKKLKYILFGLLVISSFYLTDKIIIYTENKHPIMKEIDARLDYFKIDYVNATINDNTIIPGINGKSVNRRNSYIKMSDFGAFNETFIVFDSIKPEISLKDNKDKVIVRGNPIKRQITLILEDDQKIIELLNNQNIDFTIIANLNTELSKDYEYISGETTNDKMKDLSLILNRRQINSGICLIGYSNYEFCIVKELYLVSPTIDTSKNITEIITNIKSGDIILIKKNTNTTNVNLIISEIRRQDLTPVQLSVLISENR